MKKPNCIEMIVCSLVIVTAVINIIVGVVFTVLWSVIVHLKLLEATIEFVWVEWGVLKSIPCLGLVC